MTAYYTLICMILGYAAYYLEESGFTPWATGTIVSVSCLAGGLLQGVAGKLADTDPNWSWKKQLAVYSAAALLISVLRFIVRDRIFEGISLGLLILLMWVMMPLVNSACFYYMNHGIDIDYGIARGAGSLAYAAASFVLGRLTAAGGADVLLVCYAAGFAFLLAAVLMMPYMGPVARGTEEKGSTDRAGFIKKYPLFGLMALGITFAFVFHNMISTYLINVVEGVGGGPDSMGIALGIAGAVELPVLFLYSRIEGKRGLTAAMLIATGCLFFTVRGLLYIAATGVVMIYFVQLLQSVSYGLVIAAKASYAHQAVAPEDDNTGQAVMSMTDSFGMVAGSLLGGILLSGGGTSLMLGAGTAMAAAGTVITFIAARKGISGGKTDGKQ